MLTASASEIAKVLNVTVRSVQRRANKENWMFETENGRGVPTKKFIVSKLPLEISLLINKDEIQKFQTENALVCTPGALVARVPDDFRAIARKELEVKKWETPINSTQMSLAMAKASLLGMYKNQIDAAPQGQKTTVRDQFIGAYNTGAAWPELFEKIGVVSWKTIEGWKIRAKSYGGDTLCLADRRGYVKRGETQLTPQHLKILLKCALNPNKPRLSEAIRMARAVMAQTGIQNGHSDTTYRRALLEFRDKNYHVWVFAREGVKAWNDKCAFSIQRDYSLINVGDVIVADGHTLNFDIINPWTGKPKRMTLILWYDMKSSIPLGWEIMPTENTASIAAAFRRAILRLGKFPQVAYLDNGRAFASRFFNGADLEHGFQGMFERFGVKTIFAWPYHGQSKTIERFFGTFAELERWMPTYTGTSIENKPPRLNRGERLHRKVYEKIMGDGCITLAQAHAAIAAWFDEYASRPQRGHLDGACPMDVFLPERGPGVDPAQLRMLMLAQEIRSVRANGITFLNETYYHPELYGLRGAVEIRYDLQNPDAILVFEKESGVFICEAVPQDKTHPAASILGTDADRERLTKQIEFKKSQEKQASVLCRDLLETDILPEHARQMERIGIDGRGEAIPPNKKRGIASPLRLIDAPEDVPAQSPEEIAAQVEELKAWGAAQDAAQVWKDLDGLDNIRKYERLIELDVQGLMMPKEHQHFMTYFESTAGYARDRDIYDEIRAKAIVKWQKETKVGRISEA